MVAADVPGPPLAKVAVRIAEEAGRQLLLCVCLWRCLCLYLYLCLYPMPLLCQKTIYSNLT